MGGLPLTARVHHPLHLEEATGTRLFLKCALHEHKRQPTHPLLLPCLSGDDPVKMSVLTPPSVLFSLVFR